MEIGIAFIFVLCIATYPIMTMVQKTKFWKNFEDKFFQNHNHYM